MNLRLKSLLMAVFIVMSTLCFAQNTIYVPDLKKANALFDESDFKRALTAYLDYAKTRPDSLVHPEVLYRIAYCIFLEERNKMDAKPYLERYIKLSENRFEAFFMLANFYHLEGKYDKALEFYKKFSDFVQQDELEDKNIRADVIEKVN